MTEATDPHTVKLVPDPTQRTVELLEASIDEINRDLVLRAEIRQREHASLQELLETRMATNEELALERIASIRREININEAHRLELKSDSEKTLNYTQTAAQQTADVRQGANWTISTSVGANNSSPGVPTFVRLVMVSANVWRCDISPDGVLWIKGTATLAYTMTPTHVGLHKTTWGSAVKGVTSYEFLRKVTGIT